MKYIKKFNESTGNQELDFETFELIMEDLMYNNDDIITNVFFQDFSDDVEPYYDSHITLELFSPNIDEVVGKLDDDEYYYLRELLSPFEQPGEIPTNLISTIDERIDDLKKIISQNKLIKSLFEEINEKIIPRFKNFSNYGSVTIGYDERDIRICFNMKDLPARRRDKPNLPI